MRYGDRIISGTVVFFQFAWRRIEFPYGSHNAHCTQGLSHFRVCRRVFY